MLEESRRELESQLRHPQLNGKPVYACFRTHFLFYFRFRLLLSFTFLFIVLLSPVCLLGRYILCNKQDLKEAKKPEDLKTFFRTPTLQEREKTSKVFFKGMLRLVLLCLPFSSIFVIVCHLFYLLCSESNF
jgi:hypothetical protein